MDLMNRRRLMIQPRGGRDVPPSNQIWYDAGAKVQLYETTWVVEHTYSNGRGVVTFDRDLTSMDYRWFRQTSITAVYLPDSLVDVGSKTNNVFYLCTQLTTIVLSPRTTKLGNFCFQNCSALTLSELPPTLNFIGARVFEGCVSIPSLTIPRPTPPTLGSTPFSGTSFPIYVPAESVDAYKSASGWSGYARRIFAIQE